MNLRFGAVLRLETPPTGSRAQPSRFGSLAALNPSNSPFSLLTGPLLLTGRLSAQAGLEIFELLPDAIERSSRVRQCVDRGYTKTGFGDASGIQDRPLLESAILQQQTNPPAEFRGLSVAVVYPFQICRDDPCADGNRYLLAALAIAPRIMGKQCAS